MKIIITIEGDRSVGIYEDEAIVDWPSLNRFTYKTDPEWCEQLREELSKLFTTFTDFPSHVRFEYECINCGSWEEKHLCPVEEAFGAIEEAEKE